MYAPVLLHLTHSSVNVLLHMLRVLRGERAHTTIIHQSSKSTVIAKATTEDRRFEGFLTSHAYGHVLAEIAKRDTVQFPRETAAPAPSTEGPVTVTDDSCTCAFPCTFRLPCRHILAHREMSCKSSFDADLADKRWTASYSMSSVAPVSACNISSMTSAIPPTALTAHQKYRQAMAVAADLCQFGFRSRHGRVLRMAQHSPELTG